MSCFVLLKPLYRINLTTSKSTTLKNANNLEGRVGYARFGMTAQPLDYFVDIQKRSDDQSYTKEKVTLRKRSISLAKSL